MPPAAVSMPHIQGVESKHLHEAMIKAALKPIQDPDTRLTVIAGALAGSNIGLCRDYRYLPSCDLEEHELPFRLAYGIEFSASSLITTMSPFRYSRVAMDLNQEISWTLGKDKMPDSADTDEDYWARLKAAIQRGILQWRDWSIDPILLMGDAASDERFQLALLDALSDVLPPDFNITGLANNTRRSEITHTAIETLDPTFIGARGTAEWGKRKMEQPNGCVERAYCRFWRGEGRISSSFEL